jgi:hypothetical protein
MKPPFSALKNSLLVLGCAGLLVLSGCENKQSDNAEASEATPGTVPVMTFDQPEVTLPEMTEGDTVQHVYAFKNTGNADLQVFSASASCGCTVPSYPDKPIPPGGTGEIRVVFNSKNKAGSNTKTVTVYANTKPETNTVSFKVNVLEDPTKKKGIL